VAGLRDDRDLDVGDGGAGVLCVGSGDDAVALAPDHQDGLRDPGEPFVGQRALARPAERSVADRPSLRGTQQVGVEIVMVAAVSRFAS
jgi:hypothetical protein